MTREAIEYFKFNRKIFCEEHLKICPKDSIAYQATLKEKEFYDMAIEALEQEPFINKPCVSLKVCEHDKNKVLDKIRAEIEKEADTSNRLYGISEIGLRKALKIIDKYKTESEEWVNFADDLIPIIDEVESEDKEVGGKWSICARNLKDDCWKVSDYSCNFIQFIFKGIFCLIKYDVVDLGKHGR